MTDRVTAVLRLGYTDKRTVGYVYRPSKGGCPCEELRPLYGLLTSAPTPGTTTATGHFYTMNAAEMSCPHNIRLNKDVRLNLTNVRNLYVETCSNLSGSCRFFQRTSPGGSGFPHGPKKATQAAIPLGTCYIAWSTQKPRGARRNRVELALSLGACATA